MGLSKTKYCKGVQCPKILWMDTNMPERFDRLVINEKTLQTGIEVGDLAMSYFGEFSEVPYSQDFKFMIAETQRLMKTGTAVIAEAAFSYEDDFCMVDILRKVQNGFELIEVKSSTASALEKPEKIKPIYIHDIAYQDYVLRKCGITITKKSIMLLNRDYVRRGGLNLQELFVLIDCTEIVNDLKEETENNITEIKLRASQLAEPEVLIGSRCNSPYECGYKNWCYRKLPAKNVFHIGWGMWGSKKDDAYRSGFVSFDEVLNGGLKLTEKQGRQILTETESLPPHIDHDAIRSFLSKIKYPLYFLDMETYMQAVPQWDFLSPYSQIPFQYSIHIQEKLETRHLEYLCKEGIDSRREIAERLCEDISPGACIIAYNASFEKARIKELSLLFHDLAEHLMSLHDNMIDLAEPFRSGAYYCREMGGSYSIKSVLPALCSNEPELDYSALNLIHNGNEAMNAFCDLHTKPPEQIAEIRKALLAYCRLDTLAMVKILDKLYETVK